MKIFSTYKLGNIDLKNRIVMSPMTRSRAINNIPNELMAEYYGQRADAGLLITEGTSPSKNGLGYPRIPGIYSDAHVEGWEKTTAAVHSKGGKIFIQLMHTGRVSHPANMPPDAKVVAPSAVGMTGKVYTDTEGVQPYPVPAEMTSNEIREAQEEYVLAAKNAVRAGFDGIELHGANGYLINQFINPASNRRSDEYGGSVEKRCRFVIETAQKTAAAIGREKVGIRVSPYGVMNDMVIFDEVEETYEYLAGELGKLELVYIHVVDHSSMGAPEVTPSVKNKIRTAFGGTIIASGGLDKEKAEAILQDGRAELTAFGKAYLANPDLVYRLKNDLPLNKPDEATFYSPGAKGYTDYPLAKG